jgi:carbon starvation protein CstA
MTEQEVQRSLRLVRYGGVVITVTVFVTLLAFAIVTSGAIGGATGISITGSTLNSLLPYIIGLTIAAAVLSVVLFFAYRAYLMGRVQRA